MVRADTEFGEEEVDLKRPKLKILRLAYVNCGVEKLGSSLVYVKLSWFIFHLGRGSLRLMLTLNSTFWNLYMGLRLDRSDAELTEWLWP
uniref:Uncharacterized protein n=1 Tax=Physcomitrium patens TaxID=3218 RepID=A0A7I4ERU9_PHYPA